MINYLSFLLKSTNQHGVHSPFVYNYLTKGLYEEKKISDNKQINWVLKSIQYFKPETIYIEDSKLLQNLKLDKNLITNKVSNASIILISTNSLDKIESIISKASSNQLIFIVPLKYDSYLMNKLRKNEQVILVLDFYIGALISKREEQLKQNFFLRL